MEVNCGSLPLAISFLFRPTPSCRLSHICLPQNNPPPPGRGTSRLQSVRKPAMTRSACFPPYLVRSLTTFVLYCPISRSDGLPALACFRSSLLNSDGFRPSAASRSPSSRPIRKAGRGFRFASSPLPACFNRHGKDGAGMPYRRLLPAPPVSPFLMALSFTYFSGMVIGYSVATVMYFP